MSERIKALKANYPGAVIFALQNLGRHDEANRYIKENTHKTTWDLYAKYVHGNFLPDLQRQRSAGKLLKGTFI